MLKRTLDQSRSRRIEFGKKYPTPLPHTHLPLAARSKSVFVLAGFSVSVTELVIFIILTSKEILLTFICCFVDGKKSCG
jgi:hypothetical protein